MINPWLALVIAILNEVAGTLCLKFSEGFTDKFFSLACIVFYGISFFALSLTLKKLDISIVYTIWSGSGIMILSLIGYLFFEETFSLVKLSSMFLIILGIIGLRFSS